MGRYSSYLFYGVYKALSVLVLLLRKRIKSCVCEEVVKII
nr:MAG TPA: hypothetical protein [Caudoviricetes sp.]